MISRPFDHAPKSVGIFPIFAVRHRTAKSSSIIEMQRCKTSGRGTGLAVLAGRYVRRLERQIAKIAAPKSTTTRMLSTQ